MVGRPGAVTRAVTCAGVDFTGSHAAVSSPRAVTRAVACAGVDFPGSHVAVGSPGPTHRWTGMDSFLWCYRALYLRQMKSSWAKSGSVHASS